jgi:hypothetical protein
MPPKGLRGKNTGPPLHQMVVIATKQKKLMEGTRMLPCESPGCNKQQTVLLGVGVGQGKRFVCDECFAATLSPRKRKFLLF